MVPPVSPTEMLDQYREAVERFAEQLVQPYLARLNRLDRTPRAKEFNDPIWGTVHLRDIEVLMLDSPFLQRLRRIRQLGVVHLVYPAATHTRLEHSLGVVHQVQRMIDTINGRGAVNQEQTGNVLSPHLESVLRMGALIHDIGHGAMSHVSEYALDDETECKTLRREFQKDLKLPAEKQLSEISAYLLVGSPAFGELVKTIEQLTHRNLGEGAVEKLQRLIIGRSIDDEFVLAHELISGPFDADKLDYLPRDATMCGVPIVTDTVRLIQKIRVAQVDREGLTPKLSQYVEYRSAGYKVSGISRSGGRTIDELALARTLMYDKVYRHQKVRSAETMVFEMIRRLCSLSEERPALLLLKVADEDLLGMSRQRLAEITGVDPDSDDGPTRASIDTVLDLSRRLRNRELFSRGFAIASIMTNDAYREDLHHSSGLKRFFGDMDKAPRRRSFELAVAERLRAILDVLGSTDLLDPYDGDLRAYLQFSPPKPPPKTFSSDTGHAHLVDVDGGLIQVQDDAAETVPWADAYVATRDLGHVFCPAELADHVFVAAQIEVRDKYGVRVPGSMLPYAKVTQARIDELRQRLDTANYYDGLPRDLLPEPRILRLAEAKQRIATVVDGFANYAGPVIQTEGSIGRSNSAMNTERVASFVKQFRTDDNIDCALRVLENTLLITRAHVGEALRAFVDEHPSFDQATVCALGEPKDSSAIFANLGLDYAQSAGMELLPLDRALQEPSRPIIFLDDFTGTGRQATDIMQAALGASRTEDLDEQREILTESQRQALTTRPVGFVFVVGRQKGLDHLQSKLEELGLDVTVWAHRRDPDIPTLDSVLKDHPTRDEFTSFCREVGAITLDRYGGKERAPEWIQERALGYGNDALLVASMFNTPTATLTCLWAGADPTKWEPLLPRRPKH